MNNTLRYCLLPAFFLCCALATNAQFIQNNGLVISNSTTVYTTGDWQNAGGTQVINNGLIRVHDNFVNDGTLDPTSTGGFELMYATNHTFKPGGTTFGYLSKRGAGMADLTGKILLKDSLALHNGFVRLLVAGDTIILSDDAIVKADSNAFVEGIVSHMGTGDKLFPIGIAYKAYPLKLYKMDASKVSASLMPKPVGAGPGLGLDSLSSFQYVWKVDEQATTDTAAYVELSFPVTASLTANTVVARYNSGTNDFSSMGERVIETKNGYGRIVSYSRGMTGIYTYAYGIPFNRTQDSLALRAFYYAAKGDEWTDNSGWINSSLESWKGLTFAGKAIVKIELPNNGLDSVVAEQLVDIGTLNTIDLSQNDLTFIPDFSVNKTIAVLNVSENRLTFESLEPNANVPGLLYSDQTLGNPLDSLVEVGNPFTVKFKVGGENTTYVWKKDGEVVSGASTETVSVEAIDRYNMGTYVLEATNTAFPGYTLASEMQTILGYASISGKLLYDGVGATAGTVKPLKVTSGAFIPTDTVNVSNDGTYTFEKVILGDYQVVGLADTAMTTFADALPTYYGNTIYWEEADTIAVDDHVTGIEIASAKKPGATSGPGSISGYLEEDDGNGRKNDAMAPKRVAGSGATVRRVEGGGRGKEEILTLVGYTFTNEDGNFTFDGLPAGEYLLNLQYPGYPMDPTSDIHLTVADETLKSDVMVGATVVNGKINVQKITITNVYESKDYQVQLFPNPASEYIKLKFPERSAERTIALRDVSGRTLLTFNANEPEATVAINAIQKGIYLLQVRENGVSVKTVKVSVE